MAPYGPAEVGIRQMDQRPYGSNAQAEEMRRERQLTEAQGAPARPIAPQPGHAPKPAGRPSGGTMEWQEDPPQSENGEIDYDTFLLGGLMRGGEFLERGVSGLAGAAPGEGPLPVVGEDTGADQFLPALARRIYDVLANIGAPATNLGLSPGQPRSLTEESIVTRAEELTQGGASSSDARRIAELEDAYNSLGGLLLADIAVPLAFTGAGVATASVATAGVVGAGFLSSEEQVARGQERLPVGSVGREIALLAVPEAAVIGLPLKAVRAARARLAATVVARPDEALDVARATLSDLEAAGRVADEQAALAPTPAEVRAAAEVSDEAKREADAIRHTFGIESPDDVERAVEDVTAFLRAAPPEGQTVGDEIVRAYANAEKRVERILARMADLDRPELQQTGAKVKVKKSGRTLTNEVEQVVEVIQAAAERANVDLPQEHFDALLRLREAVRAKEMEVAARNIAIREGKVIAKEETRAATRAHGKAETEAVRTVGGIERAGAAVRRADEAVEGVYEREELAALRQRARELVSGARDVERAEGAEVKVAAKGEAAAGKAEEMAERDALTVVQRADREKARLAATAARNEDRLADVRERTDRILSQTRPKTTMSGIDPEGVRAGYVRPDDAKVLEKSLIHTGKHDSEVFARWMRDFVEQNPDELRRAASMNTDDLMEVVEDVARTTGVDPEKLTRALPRRGQVAARLYLGDLVLKAEAEKWAELGQAVARGEATAEELAKATEDLSSFANSLTEGVSEIGRALWSRRLIVKDQTVALARTNAEVKHTEGVLRRTASRLSEADGKAAAVRREVTDAQKAVEDRAAEEALAVTARSEASAAEIVAKNETERAAARLKVEEAEGALARLASERETFSAAQQARISAAEAKVDEALKAHEEALAAHEAAMERAAEAYSAVREAIIRNAPKLKLSEEDMTILAKLPARSTTALINFLRESRHPKPLAVVNAWLMNSLYGNPVSLLVNGVNTFENLMFNELLEPVMRATTGRAVSHIVGRRLFAPAKVEQKARMLGAWDAIPDAYRGMVETQLDGSSALVELRWGVSGPDPITGIPRRSAAPGKKGLWIEGALRNLRALDLFNRTWTTGAESRAMVALEKWEDGAEGVGEALAGLSNGQERYIRAASRTAAANTFNDELASQSLRGKFLNLLSTDWEGLRVGLILVPAARFGFAWNRVGLEAFGMPFVRGVVGGAARGVAREGIRGLRHADPLARWKSIREIKDPAEQLAAGREASREMFRSIVGSATVVTGVWAYQNGGLTGAWPDDPAEQRRWKESGRQPASFRLGEMSVPLALLPPAIGIPLLVIATAGDLMTKEPDPDKDLWTDRTERLSAVMGEYLLGYPGVRGIVDTVNVAAQSMRGQAGQAKDRYLASKAALAIPWSASVRAATGMVDPYRRVPEGFGEEITVRVPGLSETVPVERGTLGEELRRPTYISQETPLDPYYSLLDEMGATYSAIYREIGGQQLTRREQERLKEIAGPLVKQTIDSVRGYAPYRSEPDPLRRQAFIDSKIGVARTLAVKRFAAAMIEEAIQTDVDEETMARAVTMHRVNQDDATMAALMRYLHKTGRLTPDLARRIDSLRPKTVGSKTVAEWLR